MSSSVPETAEAKIRRLETKIANLKEEVRQRDAAYGPAGTFPVSLGLTLPEDAALSALRNRYPGDVTAESLILRCWGSQSLAVPEHVFRLVSGIRSKIAGTGAGIDNVSGIGYRLTAGSASILDDLRSRARAEATKPPSTRDVPFLGLEDQVIREAWLAGKTGPEIVATLSEKGFPLRTKNQITKRADFLQLPSRKSNEWKRREDEILKDGRRRKKNYRALKAMLAQEGFSRTTGAIKKRCLDLGVNPRRGRMDETEISIVTAGFKGGLDARGVQGELAARGYVRSLHTLEERRRQILGVSKRPGWTPQRDKILEDMLTERKPVADIAAALKLTVTPVYNRARYLGFMKAPSTWTDEKIERLRQGEKNKEKLADIAREIGENYQKVAAMSKRLGLDFSRGRIYRKQPTHALQIAAE